MPGKTISFVILVFAPPVQGILIFLTMRKQEVKTSALPDNCRVSLAAKLNHAELAELFDKFDASTIAEFFEFMACSAMQNELLTDFSPNQRANFMSFNLQLQKLLTQKEVGNGN